MTPTPRISPARAGKVFCLVLCFGFALRAMLGVLSDHWLSLVGYGLPALGAWLAFWMICAFREDQMEAGFQGRGVG